MFRLPLQKNSQDKVHLRADGVVVEVKVPNAEQAIQLDPLEKSNVAVVVVVKGLKSSGKWGKVTKTNSD